MPEQLDRIELKLAELEGKIDEVAHSSRKIRGYMLWGFWITVAVIVVPLLLLPALLPSFLASFGAGAGF